MKQYPQAKNIKIRFAGQVVTLANEADRKKTKAGVELYVEKQPNGYLRPWAAIPDGTLNKYMHEQPEIVSVQWEE